MSIPRKSSSHWTNNEYRRVYNQHRQQEERLQRIKKQNKKKKDQFPSSFERYV